MTVTPSRTARLLTTPEVAEMIGIEQRTLERWRKAGTGPPYLMFGRTIRYHPARLQQWLAAHEQGAPSSRRGTPTRGEGNPSSRRGTPAVKGAPRGR